MPETRMELHWGRLMRCYVERPPTLDAMFKAAVAGDADAEAVVARSSTSMPRRGAHLVELEVRIENQLGDVTADGTSIVELPTRSGT